MPSREMSCDLESFAVTLEALLGDIPDACGEGARKAVTQSIRKTASQLRSGAFGSSGRHAWSGEYMGGFASAVLKGGLTPEGEVGNRTKPGLVHLLEKGHATLNGRRTAAFPHMAPAFADMQAKFVELAAKYIGEAIA